MAGEESAAVIYRWLQAYEVHTQVVDIFNQFFALDRGKAVAAVANALGQPLPEPPPESVQDAQTLLEWFRSAAGDQTNTGQVVILSVWTDPPVVQGHTPFKLVWEELNSGSAPTGPYKAAVYVGDRQYQVIDVEPLAPDGKANREAQVAALEEGTFDFRIYSPWNGSLDSPLETQAGRTTMNYLTVPVGAAATEQAVQGERYVEINQALGNATAYMSALNGDFQTSHIQYALQALANVAPSLDGQLDLMGKAAQMMVRDPATIGPEAQAEAKARAIDAAAALTAAQARTSIENSDPVDHPDVLNAARLTVAVADVIIAAPVPEATT